MMRLSFGEGGEEGHKLGWVRSGWVELKNHLSLKSRDSLGILKNIRPKICRRKSNFAERTQSKNLNFFFTKTLKICYYL